MFFAIKATLSFVPLPHKTTSVLHVFPSFQVTVGLALPTKPMHVSVLMHLLFNDSKVASIIPLCPNSGWSQRMLSATLAWFLPPSRRKIFDWQTSVSSRSHFDDSAPFVPLQNKLVLQVNSPENNFVRIINNKTSILALALRPLHNSTRTHPEHI